MPTTVRVKDEDKQVIDRLQARYLLATGKRISIERLISLILETAQQHEDEIIQEDEPPRLTEEETEAFLAAPSDWGVVTRDEDIDDVLYGGDEPA